MNNILLQATFNTGRGYTSEGQVITAAVVEGRDVYFNDHSRCIWGKLDELYPYKHPDAILLEEFVMGAYDHGRYVDDTEANKLKRGEVR